MFNVSEGAETASDTCEDALLEQLRDELLEGIVF